MDASTPRSDEGKLAKLHRNHLAQSIPSTLADLVPSNKRPLLVGIRVSDAEMASLRNISALLGTPLSTLAHHLVARGIKQVEAEMVSAQQQG